MRSRNYFRSVDALVRTTEDNARKLVGALEELDARFREHETEIRPTQKDIIAGGRLLLTTRAGPLDILGYTGNRSTYDDLQASTDEVITVAGSFRVLSLNELIRQKQLTDRSEDRAMLEILEALARRRNQGD